MERTFAIAGRIIKQLLRDKRTLALVFLGPVLIMFLLNVMFSANTKTDVTLATYNVPTAVTKQLSDTKHVTVDKYSSKKKALSTLDNQKADTVIIGEKSHHYTVTYANTDASKTTMSKQVFQAALTKVGVMNMQDAIKEISKRTGMPIKVNNSSNKITTHYHYGNADTGFFTKMIPVLLAFFVFFFVFLISGIALLTERTSGTLDRVLATPVRRSEIVFGYMIAYGLLAICQTIVIVFSTIWLLKIEVVGNVFNIILVNSLVAIVALAFGIFLSTFTNSEFQMMQLIPIVIVPQIFFSGIIPLDNMASWVQVIGKFLLLIYAGDALSAIILNGASLAKIQNDIWALLAFLVVFTVANILGLKRYRKV